MHPHKYLLRSKLHNVPLFWRLIRNNNHHFESPHRPRQTPCLHPVITSSCRLHGSSTPLRTLSPPCAGDELQPRNRIHRVYSCRLLRMPLRYHLYGVLRVNLALSGLQRGAVALAILSAKRVIPFNRNSRTLHYSDSWLEISRVFRFRENTQNV